MTQYIWSDADHGGAWTNPHNWETLTQGPPVGPPGAGDDAVINVSAGQVVMTDGATVATLEDPGGGMLVGDLTVTGQLTGGMLSGGSVSVGLLEASLFEGNKLSAGVISGGSNLDAGSVTVDDLEWATIKGGTVSATEINAALNEGVFLSGGSLNAGSLFLDTQFSLLEVVGGTATITSALST